MHSSHLCGTVAAIILVSVFVQPAAAQTKSGYRIDDVRCGEGKLAFPKLAIGMKSGFCAGLVAGKEEGLAFPRTLVQVPGTRFFVIADMGGWGAKQGRLLLLDPEAPEGKRVKVLIARLDLLHGLARGIDNRIYAGVVDKIFRFDPLAADPAATIEVILQNLPAQQPRLSDGTQLARNLHPLKHFVFDKTGRIYVNIGAPSDACAKGKVETKPCPESEGASPLAAVWAFTPPASGIFPPLKPGEANPPHEVFARGLRNSMAFAVHPEYPAPGFAFLQAENARDLPDDTKPNEEINALEKGRHYGWPYCYDLATPAPEYRGFLRTAATYRDFCASSAYTRPHSLVPPHAAPLGMLYYMGEKFPELAGKLLVSLHGYRPTGSRVLVYDVDPKGFPIVKPPPVRYAVSCASAQVFRTEQDPQVAAAPFEELITDWHKADVRPQGAPVGLAIAEDGAIWLVEDKNKTVIRIDRDPAASAARLPCNVRGEAQVAQLMSSVTKNAETARLLGQVRATVIEPHCKGCHADFGLKPGMNDAAKDQAVLRFMLMQEGWIVPGQPAAGRVHDRVWGKGPEKVMPANGRELVARDATYRQALEALDRVVSEMGKGRR